MQSAETAFNHRLWTVEEYHRMAETGILDEDEPVELLEGRIIWMSAKGIAHSSAVARTYKLLQNSLGDYTWIICQDPITLNQLSEPEPDITVVKIDPLDYADHHPTPREVYLIIEVADSSVKFDCNTKGKAYAQAEISDYWVLDVVERKLYVFRDFNNDGYRSEITLGEDATISPWQFPDVQIEVEKMLPPQLPVSRRA